MANSEITASEAPPKAAAPPVTVMAAVAPVLAWLIPGAGHLIQRKWIRGFLLMLSVGSMFVLGLAMSGKVYQPNTGDLLDMVGFVGDLGSGGLYLLSRAFDWGSNPIAVAVAQISRDIAIIAGVDGW